MKIIIDNSNLYAGGGLQVATSFVKDLNELQLSDTFVILNSPHADHMFNKTEFGANFQFLSISEENYNSILKRRKIVKKIENKVKPDVIFTVFGPSYHKSNFPKIVGFAWGYALYLDSPFYSNLKLLNLVKYKIINSLKILFFISNSNIIIFETENATRIFKSLYNKKIKTYSVSNTLNEIFTKPFSWINKNFSRTSDLELLCLSANYPHKNLSIIPLVIDELKKLDNKISFKFNITANEKDFEFTTYHNQYVNYLGGVKLENLPSLFNANDIVFCPTLLETFSTTYLEAMFMKKPIVASDMPFSRDICKDAAIYCSPVDAKAYAKAIYDVYSNEQLRSKLVDNGTENLKRFGNSMDRTKKYLEIIKSQVV